MKGLSCKGRLYFSILTLFIGISAVAQQGETSRALVHTLTYISHDYQFAVQGGKVINKDEYKEAQEFGESSIKFFNDCSSSWKPEDSLTIRHLIYQLDSLIKNQSSFVIVSSVAIDARNKVIKASGLAMVPTQYPSLDSGKTLYKSQCASCHGETGLGDGIAGKMLDPKPISFYDWKETKALSPFATFNTIRLGVKGTAMAPHEALADDEVWNIAFYVLSFRYQQFKDDSISKSAAIKALLDSVSLEKIATTSDEEFEKMFADSEKAIPFLAAIRLNQPQTTGSGNGFINIALTDLDQALQLYNQGKNKEAARMATMAYMDGIEPVETQIKASDPKLMSDLENQMGVVRKVMNEQRPAKEVEEAVNTAKGFIKEGTEILSKKEYSFWLALTMSLSILLREGLEAFLIIMVILSILKATNLKRAVLWVHGGWILAVLLGLVLWLGGGSLLQHQAMNAELMEGIISLAAVLMLMYVGFWLHGKSEMDKWRDYVKRLMQGAVSNGSLFGLGALSFFVVFREVFESVLFLTALDIESGNKQGNAIALGVIAAFVMVIIFAVIVLQFSARLPIAKLFRVSSLVMGVLAIVLGGKGVHALQEVGILPIHGMPMFRLELIGAFPTIETCAIQLVIITVLLVIWNAGTKKKAN